MVGFSIEEAAAEGEKGEQPLLDSKKSSIPNDTLDICLPQLEDFSLSFCDSFLDFDSIDRWFGEGDNNFCCDRSMSDLGEIGGELGVSKEGIEEVGGKLGDLIEEQLEKVRLEGKSESDRLIASNVDAVKSCEKVVVNGSEQQKKKIDETVSDAGDSSSDVESESEGSESSASSDSSSSSSDDDDEEENKSNEARSDKKKVKDEIAVEEGEIVLSDVDEMVGWSHDEDGAVGPIKSKHELNDLPPVPSVTVTLKPNHQTIPVGVILSIVGTQVIVEGVEKHNPFSEGSILWITDSRLPLGIVDEIFGPVKNPYYIVRYNSETELPAGIQQGTSISFVQEFVDHVLNDKSIYQKGYDASGENDEELMDELEFSDDEKEEEYKRMLKMKKRGTAKESKPGNKRKDKRQSKNQIHSQNPNKPPITEGQQHLIPPAATSSGLGPNMPVNQHMVPPFWPAPGLSTPNGIWNSNIGLPGGPPPNGLPWMQQSQPNPLFQANMAFQQQMGPAFPRFPLNLNALSGQPNFGIGPAWPDQNLLNALQFGVGLQQASIEQGMRPQGFQPDTNSRASANLGNFNQGRGGGGGRQGQHRGRGRFGGGGRGRHQSR